LRSIAHRVAVMYLGRVVEVADGEDVFERPAHPYTQALLAAVPVPDPARERLHRRMTLRGEVHAGASAASGCSFAPRCPRAQPRCIAEDPALARMPGGEHRAACFFPGPAVTPEEVA
jgi:oligopeptide/dipeptide ABC transporter ATP-binding protein